MKTLLPQLSFFLILTLISSNSFSQQKLIDSLRITIAAEKDAGKKAVQLSQLADALRYLDLPQAMDLTSQAIGMARQTNNAAAIAYTYIYSCTVFQKKDTIALLINAADSAVWYADKSTDAIAKALAHSRKGAVAELLNNDRKTSVKENLLALKYLEGKKAWKQESLVYYRLFGTHAEIEDLANEDKYARLCLQTAFLSGNADAECLAWQAYATNFEDQFLFTKNKVLLDSALYANKQALETFAENEDYIILQSQFAVVALNTATLYFDKYLPLQKDSVHRYLNLALAAGIKTKHLPVQVNCYLMQSDMLRKQGNITEAEMALIKAKDIAENWPYKQHRVLCRLYQSFSEFYEHKGDYKNALLFYKKYKGAFSELNNAQKIADINKLEAQFNIEKKEQELKSMTEKAEFRMKQIYLYVGIAILSLAGLLFMFRSYHYRLKYSIQQQKLLETEKEEASLLSKLKEEETIRLSLEKQDAELRALLQEEHAKLKAEEAARLQAEQKLMQAQKEQLQKELLAGALQLEHKNEMLLSLKDKLQNEQLSGKATQQLNKIISEEIRVDEDFENFKTELKDVHPEFFNRIQQRATQKLTALDLKYCAYICMKLSTKQMALLLHVEPTSIRMNKYRIKQKLGLRKEDNLEGFIAGI